MEVVTDKQIIEVTGATIGVINKSISGGNMQVINSENGVAINLFLDGEEPSCLIEGKAQDVMMYALGLKDGMSIGKRT